MLPRTPGQRAGLDRGAVLVASRGLLSERGLAGVTMRAVAGRLGVAPNALYSHVSSKAALLDDLLDDVLADVRVPAPDGADPSAGLHALLVSTYEVLLEHPDLVPLYLARQGARGPRAQRLGDAMVPLLARLGVSGPAAIDALRVLVVYTIGFAAFTAGLPFVPGSPEAGSTEPGSTEPGSTEFEAQRPVPKALVENFTGGLRWLLAGIEVSHAGSPSPVRPRPLEPPDAEAGHAGHAHPGLAHLRRDGGPRGAFDADAGRRAYRGPA